MTEENQVINEEVATEQVEQNQATEAEPQPQEQQAPKPVDHNWKEVNQVLKSQKEEILELKRRLEERERIAQIPEEPEVDEFADLDPQDYLTVEKARKMNEKLIEKKASQIARKHVEEYAQQQAIQSSEQVMRSKFDDYDYVVENFCIPLIKNDPALAKMIQSSKNPAETAYKLGKLSDAYEAQTKEQQTSPKAEKVLRNASRPTSSNAVGTPLKSQADQFSKMNQQQIWEMSQKYARGG